MSSTCHPVVLWSPNCPSSSCLRFVSQMSQNCLPTAFHNSHLSPRIGLPIVSSVFHSSPHCFPVVFQMLFPTCHLVVSCVSCKCGLPILGPEFETITAVGLLGCKAGLTVSGSPDVAGVRLSGFVLLRYLMVFVSGFPFMCLPLWLMVSGSPDASLHWSLFTCLPVWLSTASGVRLSRCLSSLVSLYLSPALASGVRMSSLCFHLAPIIFLLPSVSRFICLPTHVSRLP